MSNVESRLAGGNHVAAALVALGVITVLTGVDYLAKGLAPIYHDPALSRAPM